MKGRLRAPFFNGMKTLKSYCHTRAACYIGYITQAVVANFAPMLFIIFRESFGVSLTQVTALITVTFVVQLLVDLISAGFVDKIGYRPCIVAAHLFVAAGLVGLPLFPEWFGNAFAGLITAVVLYAIGGGLIEVLVSPIVEACPARNKAAQMSLLHSFYCWGTVLVVALTTLFLFAFGKQAWNIAAYLWAAVPLLNAVYFAFVPINALNGDGKGLPLKRLLGTGSFWLFALLILTAGASELAMSQWASAFAESGLGVSKAAGDLAGPCLFAALMGLSRILYAKFGERMNLRLCIMLSGLLCIGSYLLAALSPFPAPALVGCALCGFSVGIMWPGVFSMASERIPGGGTAMFALLALAGDAGCSIGPTTVGFLAGALGDDLQTGLLFAIAFPAISVLTLLFLGREKERRP